MLKWIVNELRGRLHPCLQAPTCHVRRQGILYQILIDCPAVANKCISITILKHTLPKMRLFFFKLNIAYSWVFRLWIGACNFFFVLLVTKLLCSDRMEMINFRNRLCWRQMFYPYFTPSAFQGHLMFCLCTKEINRSSHQMCENKQEILIQMMSSEMK